MTWLDAPDAKGLPLSSWMFEGVPFLHDTFKGGTFPSKVTDAGLVVGFYSVAIPDVDPTIDPQILLYGFIRTPADAWTTIDVGEQSGTTQLFGMNASGTLEGSALFRSDRKDADDWTVKGFTASTATRKGIPTFVRVTNTFVYPSPPAPDPLPTNFCGWTTVMAMNDAATLMAGNAGNGCSINPYSWVWMKKYAQPFAALLYTEPGASEPAATQTFVSGLSPTGLVLGTWVDWQSPDGTGDVLSPYDPRGYGLWHGYIATVT
ncbi:MAG TPA: hypothetical protein PKN27_04440 [Propionibacteriaceae bacterium]|nr:hypothetical protein [Propionibacteriaceae bacterium]